MYMVQLQKLIVDTVGFYILFVMQLLAVIFSYNEIYFVEI